MKSRTRLVCLFLLGCIVILALVYLGLCWQYAHGSSWGFSYIDLKINWDIRARAIGFMPERDDGILIDRPTVPWGLVFGQLYYAGFLPLEQAKLFNTFMHIAAYALTMGLLFSRLKNYFVLSKILTLFLLPAAHFSLMYSLWYGNEGGIICLLMINAILIVRKRPYIAGLLISLSMCKPQIAGILCFAFLLQREYKAVIFAAILDLAAWFVASAINNISMIQIFKDCFNSVRDEVGYSYLGISQILGFAGLSKNAVLAINISIAVIFVLLLYNYLKKNLRSEELFNMAAYIPACVASTMWMYKTGNDYLILIYPVAFTLILCMYDKLSKHDLKLSFLCGAYLLLSRGLVGAGIVLHNSNLALGIYKSVDNIITMIFCVVICKLLVRNQAAFNPEI